jgi:hypothetical protein
MQKEELFCLGWPTVMSYLRISTHPSIFGQPLTPDEAMANIGMFLSLPPDAHLAALLRQHGVKKLYSHDRDFLKFAFLDVRDPIA